MSNAATISDVRVGADYAAEFADFASSLSMSRSCVRTCGGTG